MRAKPCIIAYFEMVGAMNAVPRVAGLGVNGFGVVPIQELGGRAKGRHGLSDVSGRNGRRCIGEVFLDFLLDLPKARGLGFSKRFGVPSQPIGYESLRSLAVVGGPSKGKIGWAGNDPGLATRGIPCMMVSPSPSMASKNVKLSSWGIRVP